MQEFITETVTAKEARIDPVLGHDSLGKPIRNQAIMLVQPKPNINPEIEDLKSRRARFTFIKNRINLKPFKSGIIVDGNNLNDVAKIVKPCILGVVEIDKIISEPKQYWEKLIKDIHTLSLRENKTSPNDRTQLKAHKLQYAAQSVYYITGIEKQPNGFFTVHFSDSNNLPTSRKGIRVDIEPGKIKPLIDGLYLTIMPDKNKKLELKLVGLDLDLPNGSKDIVVPELKRLSSREDIINRLKKDFPWVQDKDIFKSDDTDSLETNHIINMTINGLKDSMVDHKRFHQLYLESPLTYKAIGGIDNLNKFENFYLVARDYLRLVQLSTAWKNIDSLSNTPGKERLTKINEQIIPNILPSKRLEIVTIFLATATDRYVVLLKKLNNLKAELFDENGNDLILGGYNKFVSGEETMEDIRFAGLHYQISDDIVYAIDQIINNSSQSESAAFMEEYIDVLGHEYGHIGSDKKHKGWIREEIWNDWKSVIYPRRLNGEKPFFNSHYHHTSSSNHDRGGSFTLDDMFISLMEMAENGKLKYYLQKITPDDVVRLAIATAFARKESGVFRYSGRLVIGFRTLYDSAFGKGAFDKKLEGCSNSDYLHVNDVKGTNIEATENKLLTDELRLLEKKLLERIFSNQTTNITSPNE